ncbi:MAG: efflux RND transporter periplasmic adaptor subunit [Nitrospiraceae bacterium]|nr:efflux RND transporter periplasmic adaptor subunit [Nitrospiraceae bacterium]
MVGNPMIRRMAAMLLATGLLFGGIFGYHAFKARRQRQALAAFRPPPVAVSAAKAGYLVWLPWIRAVGSLRAVRGVDVTSEVSGLVRGVYFKSGGMAAKNQALVQLNADSDIALLHSLQAAARLAGSVYERDRKQFAAQAVSKATLDADAADLKSKLAQVEAQEAVVEKKTIRAPFAGTLGITTVNPGQFINPGEKIVTLQSLDLLYADFYLPQQEVSRIRAGQKVVAETDAWPGLEFRGRITSINPRVDPATRNVEVEAALRNPRHRLLPGMYAVIKVQAGAARRYLTLPQTALTYNPYGETVFVIERHGRGPNGKPAFIARQAFVTTDGTRDGQVAVLSGIREGALVVTSGQLKLRNGSPVAIESVRPVGNPKPAARPPDG